MSRSPRVSRSSVFIADMQNTSFCRTSGDSRKMRSTRASGPSQRPSGPPIMT
jgi:hypothetical protein